jgi:hypothetical protein
LLDIPLGKASCHNCFTHGDASIGFQIKATLFIVREYKVHLYGDFKANMDLALDIYKSKGMVLPPITLWSMPLTPVTVPGIFHFGPQLVLQTGISFDVPEPVAVNYGFDLGFTFDYGIYSDNGLSSKPKLIKQGIPTIKEHQLKASKDIKVKVGGHLIPSVAISLSVLSIPAFDMRLQLDSSLGVDVTAGKRIQCPNDNLHVELYHQHDFSFTIKGPKIDTRLPIYQSGQMPIQCFFCDKCILPQSMVTSMGQSTTVGIRSTTMGGVATETASVGFVTTSATQPHLTILAAFPNEPASTTATATVSPVRGTTTVTSTNNPTPSSSTTPVTITSSTKPKPTCDPYDYNCRFTHNK